MKTWQKRVLWILAGLIAYCAVITIGVIVFLNVNIATFFWGNIWPPFIVIASSLAGMLCWYRAIEITAPPPYDLNLLVHAVINQLEADFEIKDFDAMSEMIECLLKHDRPNHDVLYQYLGDTAQHNLKEGLTAKRWEDE